MSFAIENVKDHGAVGDGVADDTAAFNAAIAALPNVSGGQSGGMVFMPRGIYKLTSTLSIVKAGVFLWGEGTAATILRPSMSSGYLIDVSGSDRQRFHGFTIDGVNATSVAQAFRLGKQVSYTEWSNVEIANFTGHSGNQYAATLEGALDNVFINVQFANNDQHLLLRDSQDHTYPSNQNVFYDCRFRDVMWSSGVAFEIRDSEANVFHGGAVQHCLGLTTVLVTSSTTHAAPIQEPSRGNVIDSMYFEENGNGQANSNGIRVAGADASTRVVVGTVIRNCKFFSSNQDNPTNQILLLNARDTVIDACYSNLGSPNVAVAKSTGVLGTRVTGTNSFAGAVQASGRPTFRCTRSAAQTINAGTTAQLTGWTETIDTNGDFATPTFTPTVAGVYRITIKLIWENSDDQQKFEAQLWKNGALYERAAVPASGTGEQSVALTSVVAMNGSTDALTFYAKNNGASARNVGVDSTISGGLIDAS